MIILIKSYRIFNKIEFTIIIGYKRNMNYLKQYEIITQYS